MLWADFSDTKINLTLHLHLGSHVEIEYKGKPILSGYRGAVLERLKNLVSEIEQLGGKEIYFSIIDRTIGTSSFNYDGSYWEENLGVIKSQSNCYIVIRR